MGSWQLAGGGGFIQEKEKEKEKRTKEPRNPGAASTRIKA
jgi:hypothetical protein